MASWKAQEQGSGSVVKAVQIVEVAEEGGLILKKNALEEILAQLPSADMHVAVLSICGEFRTGKSFFLNYLLHCLSNKVRVVLINNCSLP